LGIYIDAIHWVEIVNKRGMSQHADEGWCPLTGILPETRQGCIVCPPGPLRVLLWVINAGDPWSPDDGYSGSFPNGEPQTDMGRIYLPATGQTFHIAAIRRSRIFTLKYGG
jgi:hypothetical protein